MVKPPGTRFRCLSTGIAAGINSKSHELSIKLLKTSSRLPLNFDLIFASSLLILFISDSLDLPEIQNKKLDGLTILNDST